jgi:hypothetical protein
MAAQFGSETTHLRSVFADLWPRMRVLLDVAATKFPAKFAGHRRKMIANEQIILLVYSRAHSHSWMPDQNFSRFGLQMKRVPPVKLPGRQSVSIIEVGVQTFYRVRYIAHIGHYQAIEEIRRPSGQLHPAASASA